MSEKFDPAPADKHAEKASVKKRRGTSDHNELEQGLKESFPASDPVSSTQPKKTLIEND